MVRLARTPPPSAAGSRCSGRLQPSPTEPGRTAAATVAEFVEFAVGLPDGWGVRHRHPRNAQLKALGNGVVPQQAALALSMLLPRLAQEVAA